MRVLHLSVFCIVATAVLSCTSTVRAVDNVLSGSWSATDQQSWQQPEREYFPRTTDNARFSFDPQFFGTLRLPAVQEGTLLPEDCGNYDGVCADEKAGRYEQAFAAYEARMARCGMTGWKKVGNLGSGNEVTTLLLETPCGLRVAVRSHMEAVNHIQNGCAILKELLEDYNKPWCDGCIPRYYFYSTVSGACYEEHIPSVGIARVISNLDPVHSPAGLRGLKHFFNDGLRALYTLQRHGTIHRDFRVGFTNMFIRLRFVPKQTADTFQASAALPGPSGPSDTATSGQQGTVFRRASGGTENGTHSALRMLRRTVIHEQSAQGGRYMPWRLVFFDFGWSVSNTVPMRPNDRHEPSAVLHSDAYHFACNFYFLFQYGQCNEVVLGVEPSSARTLSQRHSIRKRNDPGALDDPTSFRGYLATILRAGYHLNSSTTLDFAAFHRALLLVDRS